MSKHIYGEAFMIMQYTSDNGESDYIWNSRDGITPFIIATRDGTSKMRHVNFHQDVYAPDHTPIVGDRIFVNTTMDVAKQYALEYVSEYWAHPEYPMSAMFDNRDEAVTYFTHHLYGDGTQPDLITVTEEHVWTPSDN